MARKSTKYKSKSTFGVEFISLTVSKQNAKTTLSLTCIGGLRDGWFLSLQKTRKSFFLNFPSRCCAVVYILCIVSVYKSHFNWKLGFLFSVSLWMYCFDLCCSPLWGDGFIVQSQTALRIEQYNPIQIRHTLFECVKSHGRLTGAYFFALVFINHFFWYFFFLNI